VIYIRRIEMEHGIEVRIEVTDTFGGEANYSWVNRQTLEVPEGTSELAMIRRVKKAIGWNGVKCEVNNMGDSLQIKPQGMCQVCFVDFFAF
jgi:hypothetical protein